MRDARHMRAPNGVSHPPVVLVAMEVFGLHENTQGVTRRLASSAHFAVAQDFISQRRSHQDYRFSGSCCRLVNSKTDGRTDVVWTEPFAGPNRRGRRHRPARHIGFLPRRTEVCGIVRPLGALKGRASRLYGPPVIRQIHLAESPTPSLPLR